MVFIILGEHISTQQASKPKAKASHIKIKAVIYAFAMPDCCIIHIDYIGGVLLVRSFTH